MYFFKVSETMHTMTSAQRTPKLTRKLFFVKVDGCVDLEYIELK